LAESGHLKKYNPSPNTRIIEPYQWLDSLSRLFCSLNESLNLYWAYKNNYNVIKQPSKKD